MTPAAKGLCVRTFRPALVSPSVTGGGNNFDIAVRLVAFMVNHGIGVDALNQVSFVPADVVANNIVAISTTPGTENKTYHVVRDDYANMMDITNLITRLTGRQFEIFSITDFVRAHPSLPQGRSALPAARLPGRLGRQHLLHGVQTLRQHLLSAGSRRLHLGVPEPSLEETVSGILKFMNRKGIISVAAREVDTPIAADADAAVTAS